jgi:hypothetical protein
MKSKLSLFLGSMLGLLLTSINMDAAIIFDTSGTVGAATVNPVNWWAQSFTTDENNYTFTSVVLGLGSVSPDSGSFVVSLYDATGASSRPGILLAALSGNAAPPIPGDYTYSGTWSLSANTTYYVVAGVISGTGSYVWKLANTVSDGSAPIGSSFSSDSGGNWDAPSTGFLLDMQVNGEVSPVPEPLNTALGIFGILLVGAQSFRCWNTRAKLPPLKPSRL